ncbi:integrase core domain protein [Desulfosporosinus acididurans]|uniref:Integrase core domain protein n=1 Tax=Desulfosporosinus acididurans TaxID=476652 RepID=A0A0J1FJZ2_9FIRM|nr:DDE-type integrase/transposase/recombinase [Desulfosporosinus acididurans]KLU63765.1 integrase core domain protein [Desulfosporosinus acididurans]
MNDQKKAEEIAAARVQLLSPLLAEGLDPAKLRELKYQICLTHGISERTIRRYLEVYQQKGFDGLKPKGRGRKPKGTIAPGLLEQAIILRREVPRRSIAQIIQILEWEGKASPGELKRSTLQEKLTKCGYSSRQMQMYASTGVSSRRFQKRFRNQLWQSDIKYGPYLPIGPKGSLKQVYLVTFIDDATRYVLHGAFYPTLDQVIVEDCFRMAIQKWGLPQAVYFDNGKQYRNKSMTRTCSKLGIRLLYARPYAAESKGKVEKFNRLIDAFLAEVALEKPKTLDRLNDLFQVWLSECYQNKPHTALENKMSPETAYRSDKEPLRFPDPEVLANAFLHSESRNVDKSGCINFMGKKYEVGLSFIGCRVDVIYDPADISELTIEYEGHAPWKAHELVIGDRVGKRPQLPEYLQLPKTEGSRLLEAAEQKHQERRERQAPALSFRALSEGGHK